MAKKKILLLSDDLRMASGIANVSKQLVMIQKGINFQKLVNRTLHLYTKDETFRKQLNEYTFLLEVSGSQF